jgi:hypothetical protein
MVGLVKERERLFLLSSFSALVLEGHLFYAGFIGENFFWGFPSSNYIVIIPISHHYSRVSAHK